MEQIYKVSHSYEYGGVIVKAKQGFALSVPATQHHGMDVSFSVDPENYDYPIVATYHVHPCLTNAYPAVFSPQDLAGARETKLPGYVLDECTGAVHYWAPGDGYMSVDDMLKMGISLYMLAQGVQVSAGAIIGTIKVDGIQVT